MCAYGDDLSRTMNPLNPAERADGRRGSRRRNRKRQRKRKKEENEERNEAASEQYTRRQSRRGRQRGGGGAAAATGGAECVRARGEGGVVSVGDDGGSARSFGRRPARPASLLAGEIVRVIGRNVGK